MFGLGPWEILLIILVILVFFGATRIPKLMRSMGQGVKEFKTGLHGDAPPDEEEKR